MDRELFEQKYFNDGYPPAWKCPSCRAALQMAPDTFTKYHGNCAAIASESWFDEEDAEMVFTGSLSCGACKGTVVFSGSCSVDRQNTEHGDWVWLKYYVPHFFYPALNLIEIPQDDQIPTRLVSAISSSFSLFWADLDACSNRLRISLELLLDGMGVPRKVQEAASRDMTLHHRIERIDVAKFGPIKRMFEALKLVGNEGSHELGVTTHSDVLDCYEIIEHCLQVIYPPPNQAQRLVEIADQLIAKRIRSR